MAGQSLHQRGYRSAMHRASLNESAAAGLLLSTTWPLLEDQGSIPFCYDLSFAWSSSTQSVLSIWNVISATATSHRVLLSVGGPEQRSQRKSHFWQSFPSAGTAPTSRPCRGFSRCPLRHALLPVPWQGFEKGLSVSRSQLNVILFCVIPVPIDHTWIWLRLHDFQWDLSGSVYAATAKSVSE